MIEKNRQQSQEKKQDALTHRPDQASNAQEENLIEVVEVIDSLP